MKLFSHILCATDFSPSAERGLAIALKLATGFDAKLTVIHVDDSSWMSIGNLAPLPDIQKEGREHIEKSLRDLSSRHDLAGAEIEVLEGKPHELIAEKVTSSGADLLVLGSHGASGWEMRHLGAVAEKLLHRVGVSMFVVPPEAQGGGETLLGHSGPTGLEKLLLAVDLGVTGESVVRHAVELARHYHSKLVVLHVAAPAETLFPGSGAFWSGSELADVEARLEEARSREMSGILSSPVQKELGAELLIREGIPFETITATARERGVDLAILGAGGQEGKERGWLGSTAHKVLRTGVCPVLLVKGS